MEGVAMSDSINDHLEIHLEPLPFQQIPNWVFESEISPIAIKLYLVLRRNGDNKRGTSYWSRKKLSEQMSCSINTVDRAKKELQDIGAICQTNRKNEKGDWTSNLYHIHLSANEKCKYLSPQVSRPTPADGGTPTPTDGGQTNNHIELRTKELNTHASFDAEVHDACNLLADLIAGNGSKRPAVTDKWLADMERLHRIDERSWEQITKAVHWCQDDDFWKANIMSPAKLRKQYDQLRLAAQRDQKKQSPASGWLGILNRVREQEPLELER
jgi:hypothetical protein